MLTGDTRFTDTCAELTRPYLYTLLRLRALANLRQNLLHVDLASIRGLKLDGDANELQTACVCML
jgi:hypothetical protein